MHFFCCCKDGPMVEVVRGAPRSIASLGVTV